MYVVCGLRSLPSRRECASSMNEDKVLLVRGAMVRATVCQNVVLRKSPTAFFCQQLVFCRELRIDEIRRSLGCNYPLEILTFNREHLVNGRWFTSRQAIYFCFVVF